MEEAEFVSNCMVFAVLFELEDGMPKNLKVYTFDNDEVLNPSTALLREAQAAAAKHIVDNNLMGGAK